MVPDLVDLRLEVVYWLRQTAVPLRPGDDIDRTQLRGLSEQVQGRLTDESLLYSKAVVSGESALSPANDIVRFQFAFSLIAHFAVLADEFHTLVREYEMSLPEETNGAKAGTSIETVSIHYALCASPYCLGSGGTGGRDVWILGTGTTPFLSLADPRGVSGEGN
ncbi:hypothetical protein Pmar_PMAR009788 [Perkinsus marinus ATCC 50983]|uniref:Uncharacterized protein n=1 Tax=Perkinsus marinus (strain ATCC 50983 / TXsc) TaxID=423536 RepID=C5KM17_PERM5|nr:hypothetical protein Pmar_PMAR009788 [Perkinsus marinus ATCC 50983]EER14477.1 hypothetical protein Pmar_PMAR009788 [Perkinsus marinus ATCC 50983]|eukprot:XP_002782682.1 hypothetical protein Pmar_PMAR009788 [Perkinsus marinus ATCC 50983]